VPAAPVGFSTTRCDARNTARLKPAFRRNGTITTGLLEPQTATSEVLQVISSSLGPKGWNCCMSGRSLFGTPLGYLRRNTLLLLQYFHLCIATVCREASVPRHGTQGASLGAWRAALCARPTGVPPSTRTSLGAPPLYRLS
jgi:hypothetical protein